MRDDLPRRVPTATYRLQLNGSFTFHEASALAGYLSALGVSDVYLSPIFTARPGSTHGYDVVDHSQIGPELGGDEAFLAFARQVRELGMGIILDVVPNHMDITTADNLWWMDVLENGPSSPYAEHFDVDWAPPKLDLADKVLLPVLGDQFGRVVDEQGIGLRRKEGAFFIECSGRTLPVAPKSWSGVLAPAHAALVASLGADHPSVLELESIVTAIRNLPARTERDPERVRERQREKEIIKARLATLLEEAAPVAEAVDAAVATVNGVRGQPASFDALEQVLVDQAYRLSYWRVAADEINYRRFFDINELAAIRVERPEVFEATHALPFGLFERGLIDGLRVDHVDGLYDPLDYLSRMPHGMFVVVEKILGPHERLAADWPVHGTTGYDFLRILNGLFVDLRGRRTLRDLYRRHTGFDLDFADIAYRCKKIILRVSMVSELTVLARHLDRISEQHRYSRDFTLNSLQEALVEVIACFPVYRTYLRAETQEVAADDRRHIGMAMAQARRRNPAVSASVFDFIGTVLLHQDPEGLTDQERSARRDFVQRFQQITGPVMAKGVEDTAFYRYLPLASLGEVGGDPERIGTSPDAFHAFCAARAEHWPLSLSATSTHDTKRSEDVRARISVLSEVAPEWRRAVMRWTRLNAALRSEVDGEEAPDRNDEYLLYQTLIGTWPLALGTAHTDPGYAQRIVDYMRKALREAKRHTSWIDPNTAYEQATESFVRGILDPARGVAFRNELEGFLQPLVRPGLLNALSQAVLKGTAPGIPDTYQGTELWDFSLVDPDNRRPVDFDARRAALASLDDEAARDPAGLCDRLLSRIETGEVKLYVISRILRHRRAMADLFARGRYLPARITGPQRAHVVAFVRRRGPRSVLVAVARLHASLAASSGGAAWQGNDVRLPAGLDGSWRDLFSGRSVAAQRLERAHVLPLDEVFRHLPVAVLERQSE